MTTRLIENAKPDLKKAIEHLQTQLSGIRTGRASSGLVENIEVDTYGTKTPLKNIASITIPEPRSITIQPWDKNNLKEIEKAIASSNLGIQPVNDGNNIRINLPPLTEERRVELTKIIKQISESTRVRIRNIRENIWKEVGRLLKDKEITEDDKFETQEELKNLVDEYNDKVKDMVQKKEEEIMTV